MKVKEKFEKTRHGKSKDTFYEEEEVQYIVIVCKQAFEVSDKEKNNIKTHRPVHWHTYSTLKTHRESVPLRVSTAGIILFKNCAFADYPPIACKIY